MGLKLSPPNGEKDLTPIILYPNQGRGFGHGITSSGIGGDSLPEGYDRTIAMSDQGGTVLSPSLRLRTLTGTGRTPNVAAVPWRTSAAVPFVVLIAGDLVQLYTNGATAAETDATAARYFSACFHDDGAGTAYIYAGTDLTSGFLNRRTQAGTWTEDADVRAKYIVSAAGALWRSTSDYQVSKCPAGSEPFTIGNWGSSIQVGTNDAVIVNAGAIGAASVWFKEDGIWIYDEANTRFTNRLPVPKSLDNFPFVTPDGEGGLWTATARGEMVHIGPYGQITPIAGSRNLERDSAYGPVRALAVSGSDLYAVLGAHYRLCQPSGLKVLKTVDNFATFTDYSTQATDGDYSTVVNINALDVIGNGDALLVGFDAPVAAVKFVIGTANTATSAAALALSTGAGTWNAAVTEVDGTASFSGAATFSVTGVISIGPMTDTSTWAPATYNGLTKYWVRVTVSSLLSAAATIAEVAIVPLRTAQHFSTAVQDTTADFEASGGCHKLLRGRLAGNEIVWNDIGMIPFASVNDRPSVCVADIPDEQASRQLIINTWQMWRMGLPEHDHPSVMLYPQLAGTAAGSEAYPAFYPSKVDLGAVTHKLRYLECIGSDFTEGTDNWYAAYRWGDTSPWNVLTGIAHKHALFKVDDQVGGTLLTTAFQIKDGAATDPVGPSGRWIIAWVKPDDRRGSDIGEDARAAREVS